MTPTEFDASKLSSGMYFYNLLREIFRQAQDKITLPRRNFC